MKICGICKIARPYNEFHKNKKAKDGLQTQCKKCVKQWCIDNAEHLKQYRLDNADKISEYGKQYAIDNADKVRQKNKKYWQSPHGKRVKKSLNHKRRASIKANTVGKHFTPDDLIMKLKLQKGECVYCQTSIKTGYHIDHIIPPCDGGGNEAWNIQLLCAKCNKSKYDNPAHEFAQQHGMLV